MISAASEQIPDRTERHTGVALALGIATLVAIYLWQFVSGDRFFIRKTAVLPVFVLYGLLQRRRVAFLTAVMAVMSVPFINPSLSTWV